LRGGYYSGHFAWFRFFLPSVSLVSGLAAGAVCDESGLTGRGLKPGQPPPVPPPAQENPAKAKIVSANRNAFVITA